MIRAKMSPGGWGGKGQVGAQIQLNAVYEGNSELQGVSENDLFGKSTPSGALELVGAIDFSKYNLDPNEEYYIDIEPFTDEGANDLSHKAGYIDVVEMKKVFQSEPNPNFPQYNTFRFASTEINITGHLYMSVANPSATEELKKFERALVGIRLARGRRSDAEIAVREKHLIQYEADIRKAAADRKYTGEEAEAWIEGCLKGYKIKLARARGEV